MYNIKYILEAEENMLTIYDFIAKDNPLIAKHVIKNILSAIQTLSFFPQMGKETKSHMWLRTITETVFKYRIFYDFDGNIITILSISKYTNVEI